MCTPVEQSQPPKLTVKKEVKGGQSDDSFSFTNEGPESPEHFSLQNGQSREFITAGKYTIFESDHDGYRLSKLVCTGPGKEHAIVYKTTRKIVVDLQPGDDITCTFTNKKMREREPKKGTIIVEKLTIGGGGDTEFEFDLTGQGSFKLKSGERKTFAGLEVGQYAVEENLPVGWSLKSASCGKGQRSGNKITFQLEKDETITCTFTNFKEKDDKMEDVTKVFIHRRVDNLLTHGPDRARLLRRLEEQQQPGSLKDHEPLKLMGGMLAGLVGSRAMDESDIGPAGTGMIRIGPFGDDDENHSSLTRSRIGGFGSAAFSQLGRSSGSSDFSLPAFKFSTSLSELRMAMQAVEAKKEEEKAQLMGEHGLGGQPYTRPITGARPERLDIWVEGQMSRYDDSTGGIRREGDFKILYVGADYALSPGILVGTLVQFDLTNEDVKDPDLTGSVDGRGWMAGPYIGIKLTDHLIFDARAAWGTSDNDIELYDDAAKWRKGSFDTTRWLATASLTGNWYYGAWRLTPQVSLAYGHEEYDTYKNSLGQTVDGAGVSIGRATFGTEVGYRIMTSDGTLVEPHLGISGIWNFDSDDLIIDGVVVETNASRAKLDGGILVRRPDGMGLRAAVSYDGIGASDFEAWSGQVWLNVPLN